MWTQLKSMEYLNNDRISQYSSQCSPAAEFHTWSREQQRRRSGLSCQGKSVVGRSYRKSAFVGLIKGQTYWRFCLVPAEHFTYHRDGTIKVNSKSGERIRSLPEWISPTWTLSSRLEGELFTHNIFPWKKDMAATKRKTFPKALGSPAPEPVCARLRQPAISIFACYWRAGE